MTQKQAIQLFEERKVRTVWDDEAGKWYVSVIDVVGVLTYILLLRHNTGRTFLPFDFARQDVRFWAGERGNALTPHDPARRAS
ncbi:hypothetical protein [Alistipes finegoldii]|uniref:hypothetical protein n=1 Tax=Alistipes finegoldii TaxID=214856 RepID=UPI00272E3AD5|nr:hypothetical protein [Alistipes finegoldii]